jgi:cyclophilin family peptidyl-prolyl cis-trans isomerase
MATRFGRFRVYLPGRPRALSVCGHSHFACVAVKVAVILFFGCAGLSMMIANAHGNSFVEFDYNISSATRARSSVFVELYDDRPQNTANFLRYVNGGLFNSSLMHRLAYTSGSPSVPFVLQGGGYYPQYIDEPLTPLQKSLNPNLTVDLDSNYATPNPTVNGEFNSSPPHHNEKGTIAMALTSTGGVPNPNSGTSQYFFNLRDNSSSLDSAFTVFAGVAGDGMSLIDVYANQLLGGNPAYHNLNPDTNDDGFPDGGPFDTVPILFGSSSFLPLIVNQAKVVDYLGSSVVTDVPASGLTIANKDMFLDTGTTLTGTGVLTIGVGRTLGARENYVISRPVVNHGNLSPGLALGVIGISNIYQQFNDGKLSLQLAGLTADTQYDRLSTNNYAYLAGRLQVSTLNGFTPALGNSFTVLTAGLIIGDFDSYDLPQLASGQAWKVGQTTTAITLTVVEGDYNRDGVIDANDYVVWRKTRNTSITAWSGADGNGDGLVNDADLTIWQSNLGAIGGGVHGAGSGANGLAISSVPEPSCATLGLLGILMCSAARRRRSKIGQ